MGMKYKLGIVGKDNAYSLSPYIHLSFGKEADIQLTYDIFDLDTSPLEFIEKFTSKKFGSIDNPLLLSVRSGSRVSMPGMMDTILNLGMNDKTVSSLEKQTNNKRFAFDSYRRFIQMYSDVVLNLDSGLFEDALENLKLTKMISFSVNRV